MGFSGGKHMKCFRDRIWHLSSQHCICCRYFWRSTRTRIRTSLARKSSICGTLRNCENIWKIVVLISLVIIANWGLFTMLPGYVCNCVAQRAKTSSNCREKKGKALNRWNLASFSRGSGKLVRRKSTFPWIRQWLTLKHTWWKTMIENPWILIQNDFLRSRVFKMIWAHFNAFVYLENSSCEAFWSNPWTLQHQNRM